MAFAALKERAQRINRAIGGHRFLFDTVAFGRSDLAVTRAEAEIARGPPARAGRRRAGGVARSLARPVAARPHPGHRRPRAPATRRCWACSAPRRARAAAPIDTRARSPRLAYEGFRPDAGTGEGDVAARMEIRALELETVFAVLDGLLERAR